MYNILNFTIMFFQAINQMITAGTDLSINIRRVNNNLTVAVVPRRSGVKDGERIVPLILNGTPVNVSYIRKASEIALFADSAQVNTWQAPASRSNPMLEEWYYIDTSSNQPNAHFRHGERANVVFMDGHASMEPPVPGSIDMRLPAANIGLLRSEILRW